VSVWSVSFNMFVIRVFHASTLVLSLGLLCNKIFTYLLARKKKQNRLARWVVYKNYYSLALDDRFRSPTALATYSQSSNHGINVGGATLYLLRSRR